MSRTGKALRITTAEDESERSRMREETGVGGEGGERRKKRERGGGGEGGRQGGRERER